MAIASSKHRYHYMVYGVSNKILFLGNSFGLENGVCVSGVHLPNPSHIMYNSEPVVLEVSHAITNE